MTRSRFESSPSNALCHIEVATFTPQGEKEDFKQYVAHIQVGLYMRAAYRREQNFSGLDSALRSSAPQKPAPQPRKPPAGKPTAPPPPASGTRNRTDPAPRGSNRITTESIHCSVANGHRREGDVRVEVRTT